MKRLLSGFAVALAGLSAAPAHADVVIGPRFSYYFDNSNLRTSDLEGLQDARNTVNEELTDDLRVASGLDDLTLSVQDNGTATNGNQVAFPMIGAMVNFGDDRDRFTFIGMVGQGETASQLVSSRQTTIAASGLNLNEVTVIQTVSQDKIDRLDAELSWQRRLNENFAISAGVRYERLDIAGEGAIIIQETDAVSAFVADALGADAPISNVVGARSPARIETERKLETFSGRIGVTAFVPFSDSGVAFFTGMVQASNQPSSNFETQFIGRDGDVVRVETRNDRGEWSVGPDIAVGAQFVLTDGVALDVRYRAILYFPLSGDFQFSDSRVNHGVNLGVSLRL